MGDVRHCVDNGELEHYEPKVHLTNGAVTGVEALVRWRHPEHGLLLPADFVPLAESTGAIVPLTLRAQDTALRQTRSWLDGDTRLGVSVNVSARHLTDLSLPDHIGHALARHDVPATMLTIEVTESTMLAEPERSVLVIGRLRDLGVHIAIDDYGTGDSSLTYVRQLDADELKIDGSFISAMTGPGADEVIVRSTMELGHNLGLRVVAQRIQDPATLALLTALSCDMAQGPVIAPAMPAPQLEQWLTRRTVSPSTPHAIGVNLEHDLADAP